MNDDFHNTKTIEKKNVGHIQKVSRLFIQDSSAPEDAINKDIWNSFMVSDAVYAGKFEFPVLFPTHQIPNSLIAFSKALSSHDYNQWVHFYENDISFERLWRNPLKYLPLLKKFNGVILPDFSLYRDMPLTMQIWNIYRSRAIGCWLQREGINIIVNIRYGDERTYSVCCDGVSENCVISIGTHGIMRRSVDRQYLFQGLDTVIAILHPSDIIIYGTAPDKYFHKYVCSGIRIHAFESEYAITHKKGGN